MLLQNQPLTDFTSAQTTPDGPVPLEPLLQNTQHVSLAMKNAQNLERLDSWCVEDEVGKYLVKQNWPAGEIGAPMPAVWNFREFIEALE